ncbi:MAG: hypothetical protein ACYC36_02480 [Bellilinea sp.]
MKKFKTSALVSAWLNQFAEEGKDVGKNMFFQGDTIYSYGFHFPIAQLFTTPSGEQVILFTTQTNSSTTAHHVSYVRQGIRGSSRRVICCQHPEYRTQFDMEANVRAFKLVMDNIAAMHHKARKPELYSGDIYRQIKRAREYCEVMGLAVPLWARMPEGIEPGKPLIAAMQTYQEARV